MSESHPRPWSVKYDQKFPEWDPKACPYVVDANGEDVIMVPQTWELGHPGLYDEKADELAHLIVEGVNAWSWPAVKRPVSNKLPAGDLSQASPELLGGDISLAEFMARHNLTQQDLLDLLETKAQLADEHLPAPDWTVTADDVRNVLMLVLEENDQLPDVSGLTAEQLTKVYDWAVDLSLEASDNDVTVGPAPECLRMLLPADHYFQTWRVPGPGVFEV